MRKTVVFLVLTFALDWGLVALYLGLGGRWAPPWSAVVATAYMFGPAVSAIVVQRWISGEGVTAPLGISLRPDRWYLAAWLPPPALALAAFACGLLVPEVSFSPEMEGLYDRVGSNLSASEAEELRSALESLPVDYLWIALGLALVAGPTVNAIAALGEELGWRGLLQRELGPLGFWTSSAAFGVIWGVWRRGSRSSSLREAASCRSDSPVPRACSHSR